MLSDLPGEPLGESIPNFHNMPFRLEELKEAIQKNAAGRLGKVQSIVDELLGRAEDMCKAERLHAEGKLPKRIAHCDTKVNNMLFDREGKFLCVIDLDTTMPGFVLSDFGDFIRTAANTGAEDDRNLGNVGMSMEMFEAYTRGYLSQRKGNLTESEISHLAFSARYITYEQVLRFLMDYIDGDVYYKISYPEHNLVRTRAQYRMLQSIEAQYGEMMRTVEKYAR